jgi:16S rRNA (cytosine1402-N4)-methyltransferase
VLPNALPHSAADHVAVLAEEVRELLAVKPGETVVDATFGAGGHASLLAADLGGRGRFIAIDRDPTVRLYFDRFARRSRVQPRFLRGSFDTILEQLAGNGVNADAILLDLGISSMQVDRPERGFSYAVDAPLDMRMDPGAPLSARDLVNEADERELAELFRRYGEERFARQIARAIVRRRSEHPYERTAELVDTIRASVPAPRRFGDGHPARRVFQALRIAVNDELGALAAWLDGLPGLLAPGGRAAVISFHSLEDRRVKEKFRALTHACTCPPDLPICACGAKATFAPVTRKAVVAGTAETARNPRARSAKLRAIEKLR